MNKTLLQYPEWTASLVLLRRCLQLECGQGVDYEMAEGDGDFKT
jgi:hypothetical protein